MLRGCWSSFHHLFLIIILWATLNILCKKKCAKLFAYVLPEKKHKICTCFFKWKAVKQSQTPGFPRHHADNQPQLLQNTLEKLVLNYKPMKKFWTTCTFTKCPTSTWAFSCKLMLKFRTICIFTYCPTLNWALQLGSSQLLRNTL